MVLSPSLIYYVLPLAQARPKMPCIHTSVLHNTIVPLTSHTQSSLAPNSTCGSPGYNLPLHILIALAHSKYHSSEVQLRVVGLICDFVKVPSIHEFIPYI